MENTKNVNVISTPNIEGNIGSCTTNNVEVIQHSGLWKTTGENVTTNSCTGVVTTSPYYEIGALPIILIMIAMAVGAISFVAWINTR